jgi:predicted SAM-dependent methyltransferase
MLARINIGPDIFKIPGMINVDIRLSVYPNIVMDVKRMAFKDRIASEIHMGNVLEHLLIIDVPTALSECKRILIDSGIFYLTIPFVDVAEECYQRGEITADGLKRIVYGEESGYNSHKTEYRRGDLERILLCNGFRTEPLNLNTFPYLIVSNTRNPKPDPWQYGVKAFKI